MPHILCIEPNAVLARTYQRAFEHIGYTVVCANGAQAAILAADARRPDVVTIELQLSGHDGIEFLHEFRSYPEWQTIPVVVVSNVLPATLEPLRQSFADDLGVHVCLYKPKTSLQRLLREVKRQVAGG